MSDGWRKNVEVVRDELEEFGRDQMRNFKRLLKPSLNPKNREHFVPHVLMALISTTTAMKRTWAYLIAMILLYKLGVWLGGWLYGLLWV